MQVQEKRRHHGAARPRTPWVRGVGGAALPPEQANEFRRKCSEYTGPARWLLPRPAPAPTARAQVRAARRRIGAGALPGSSCAWSWP